MCDPKFVTLIQLDSLELGYNQIEFDRHENDHNIMI